MTVGDGPLHMDAGPQKLRLRNENGDLQNLNVIKIDQIVVEYNDTSITPVTWGKIKALYRE